MDKWAIEYKYIVVHLLSAVWLFASPWIAASQALLSFVISWSLLKFMPTESVMLSNHLILCCPLLLLPSVFPSISVFSNESTFHIRWTKYWSFSLSISPFSEYSGLTSNSHKYIGNISQVYWISVNTAKIFSRVYCLFECITAVATWSLCSIASSLFDCQFFSLSSLNDCNQISFYFFQTIHRIEKEICIYIHTYTCILYSLIFEGMSHWAVCYIDK